MKFIKKIFRLQLFYLVTRLGIGFIFIYAGMVKLIDPEAFARTISQYGLVPDFLLAPVAIGLPAIELLAGIGLIFNIRGSLGVIFSLLIMFIFILWYGIFREFNIDCGCFTSDEIGGINSLKQAFYRDLAMIAGVFYLFLYKRATSDSGKTLFAFISKLKNKEE